MTIAAAVKALEETDAFVALLCRQTQVAVVQKWEWRRARHRGVDLDDDEQEEAHLRLADVLSPDEMAILDGLGMIAVPTAHAEAMQTVEPDPLPDDVRLALRLAQEDLI